MTLPIHADFLQLDYQQDPNEYDAEHFFERDGSEKFDANSANQMLIMLNQIALDIHLDAYALKKLEIFLRTELPFFTVNRRLVRQWVNENFLY